MSFWFICRALKYAWRIVTAEKKANNITLINQFPIPFMQDVLIRQLSDI